MNETTKERKEKNVQMNRRRKEERREEVKDNRKQGVN